jgi:hypothetical protein
MSTQVSVTLPNDLYQHIDDLARLLNQTTADVISTIINNAFQGVNQKLNTPNIEVSVRDEQIKPQVVLTLPDATANFLEELYKPGSQTTTPELIMIMIPKDKSIPDLLRNTIASNLGQFSRKRKAENLVSEMPDSELLALIAARGQLAASDPMQQQIDIFRTTLWELLQNDQDKINRFYAAKHEAYRRGLITDHDLLF